MRIMIGNDLNSDSFESLFKSHFGDLVGFVCSYVNDEEVAKDIVHDVFPRGVEESKEIGYFLFFEVLPVHLIQELRLELFETFACRGYERTGSC